jgi:chaperone modulatory protein CbpM
VEHPEFLSRAHLQAEVLQAWVAAGWLTPSTEVGTEGGAPRFTEIDVGVILDLIDQVHGLRRTLGDLLSAIHAQPEDMRERLAVHVRETITDWARPVPEREPPDRDRNRQI